MSSSPINVFWFRRDLRLEDNAGLYHALKAGLPVLPVFIFDRNILDDLEEKADQRVAFIHSAILALQDDFAPFNSSLKVYHGLPAEIFRQLIIDYPVQTVFANHDYEPYAIQRDRDIESFLNLHGISFRTYKDQVIFEKNEIVKKDGTAYSVFSPYSRSWMAGLTNFQLKSYPVQKYASSLLNVAHQPVPTLEAMGFIRGKGKFPAPDPDPELIKKYAATRDFPAEHGTSRLGVHLRFGTISIRALARMSKSSSQVFLNELIWRDFYHMILWQFPRVGAGKAFKPEYDRIPWRNNESEFEKWKTGNTGYPIVDAGMRELNATGFMHNRVRMIVASFLSKHLLIDWRWGEAYFAEKLLDFDFASNNGGWQWSSGSGCDASPYFRIFNPYIQTKKFDPDFRYVFTWVPEFQEFSYPRPIVDHEFARKRCLEVYAKALAKQ